MNTPHPNPVDKIVRDRLLLASGQTEGDFPRRLLIVTCGGEDASYVRLSITAPGMSDAGIYQIRRDLVAGLRAALHPACPADDEIDWEALSEPEFEELNRWIHKIALERNKLTEISEVVVTIEDPQIMGSESASAIMGHVKGFLKKAAREVGRSLVILMGNQRLVPLDFRVEERRDSMDVELPKELLLRNIRRTGDELIEDQDERALRSLKRTLELLLGAAPEMHIVHTYPRSARDAAKISIVFAGRQTMTTADQVNWAQGIVATALRLHTYVEGFYTRLVIVPAQAEVEIYDDGSEPADHYHEY